METVLVLAWLASVIAFWTGVFKPRAFNRNGKTYTRKQILGTFGVIGTALLIGVAVAAPAQPSATASKDGKTNTGTTKQLQKPKVVKTSKTETTTKPVVYPTQDINDANLPKGQIQDRQAGANGVETITYKVDYTNGKETGRAQISDSVTTQPVAHIVAHGTYVAPTPAYSTPATNNTGGATAKCVDGSLSYSAHRQGTCSHHGGVSVWY